MRSSRPTVLLVALILLSGRCLAADDKDPGVVQAAEIEKMFQQLDTDKDGVLALEELNKAKPWSAGSKSQTAFQTADKNGDGRLSLDEFKQVAAAKLHRPPEKSKKESRSGGLRELLRRIPIIQMTEKVEVTLEDGKMTAVPETVPPANLVLFTVSNKTKNTHHFVVAVTGFPPDKLPVKDGRVRYFTYFDEPYRMEFRDGGGWSEQHARDSDVTWAPHRREPGVKIAPGKTVEFREVHMYDPKFAPGTSFVLFCNEPGHYEKGEYARVVVK